MNIINLLEQGRKIIEDNPTAFLLYSLYSSVQTQEGKVFLELEDLSNLAKLLGISSEEIEKNNNYLKDKGLLSYTIEGVIQIPTLSKQLDINWSSICKDANILLNKTQLKKALKELGDSHFSIRSLVEYFKLDEQLVKFILNYHPSFKNELIYTYREVKADKENPKPEKVKPSKLTSEEYMAQLARADKDRKGKVILLKDFKEPQFLLDFCRKYEAFYKTPYKWTSNPYSSKERKDITAIMHAFNNNPETIINYLEWAFKTIAPTLKGVLGTGLLAHARSINNYTASEIKRNNSTAPTGTNTKAIVDWD